MAGKDSEIITLRSDCNPWERQVPGESELMYSRFLVYRDLGPESDRMRQTLEVLNSTGDKISYATIKVYSSTYRWSARAAAWDRYMVQADRARMVKRRRKAVDEQCRAAERLRLKAMEALTSVDPMDLAPGDIVRFVDLAHRIEQSVYKEYLAEAPATATETAGLDAKDVAAWSPAERRKRLEQIGSELSKRRLRAVDDDEVVA